MWEFLMICILLENYLSMQMTHKFLEYSLRGYFSTQMIRNLLEKLNDDMWEWEWHATSLSANLLSSLIRVLNDLYGWDSNENPQAINPKGWVKCSLIKCWCRLWSSNQRFYAHETKAIVIDEAVDDVHPPCGRNMYLNCFCFVIEKFSQ